MVKHPLLDADILQYEVAFAAESAWKYQHKERGEESPFPPPFGFVTEICDERIAEIIKGSEGELKPLFFFTQGKNFRTDIAVTQPYKNRPSNKPYYHAAIKAYIESKFTCYEKEGLEADDLIAIWMTKYPDISICCSRDKDLRQVPGWHYGWELGKQGSFGPYCYSQDGEIALSKDRKKIIGGGDLFFLAQMITGDPVDTVPGCPKKGPVEAYNALKDCQGMVDGIQVVKRVYQECYPSNWETVMLEQGQLLWMVREIRDGKPVMWEI